MFCSGSSTSSSALEGSPRQSAPSLIDLVEHEHRVVGAGLAHGADDDPGHRPHVGAPMPADLGLVAHAADVMRTNLRPMRLGDAVAEAGLADAGRADEAQDRPVQVGLELADRQELEDAVFDLFEVVVVAVEDLARVRHVEVVLAVHRPGQRDDPVEVGADHGVLGALRRDVGEPVEPPAGGLVDLFRKLELVDLRAQLGDLRFLLVGLAQLLLDGAQLLAQEVLALALVDLAAHVALDLGAELQHVELAREDADERACAPRRRSPRAAPARCSCRAHGARTWRRQIRSGHRLARRHRFAHLSCRRWFLFDERLRPAFFWAWSAYVLILLVKTGDKKYWLHL